MRKLKFKNNSLQIRMNWEKTLKRYSAIPTNMKNLIKINFNIDIPNTLIMNAIKSKDPSEIFDFLKKHSLHISGADKEKSKPTILEKTLNGFPDNVALFSISKDEKSENALKFIFDGYFYYLPKATSTTLEELKLYLISTLILDNNAHRWAIFADGTIDNLNNENVSPNYFKHPNTDKHNQVLCPICGEKMFYLD